MRGCQGRDRKYTDYDALKIALSKLAATSNKLELPVYIPYNMGCGNAGGDWQVVNKLIEQYIPSAIIIKVECDRTQPS